MDTDIVFWDDFLEQNISAVSLDSIVLPIKSSVMSVSPGHAQTCWLRRQVKYKLYIKTRIKYNALTMPFQIAHLKSIIIIIKSKIVKKHLNMI